MTTAPKQKFREVAIDLIDVPKEYVRKTPNDDADKSLSASVKLSGIHQPLTVIPHGTRFLLVKGTRRLAAAEENGLERVPVIVNFPPTGTTGKALKAYRDWLRFILDSKRQDLTPSQEVAVLEEAQRTFKLNNKEIAALLGWDPATVTNKKRIEHYAKPIVAAIDAGETTLHHAQALWGLRPQAQIKVFSELKEEFRESSGRKLQSLVRKRFDPKKHPENALCVICQVRREHGENILIQPATEVHHHRGRRGRLLCWVPGFRASCRRCRDFPHDNKKRAREWGILAPTTVYDVFPGNGN